MSSFEKIGLYPLTDTLSSGAYGASSMAQASRFAIEAYLRIEHKLHGVNVSMSGTQLAEYSIPLKFTYRRASNLECR